MIFFDNEAKQLLKLINLSCPMSEKGKNILALYKKEKLSLEELREKLPITAATIYSALQDKEKQITQSTIIRAFGSEIHLGQTHERMQNRVIMIQGKLKPFLEFLASKSIYIDSEENQAALTLMDTLIATVVKKIINKNGRKRAILQFLHGITIKNAAIPLEIEGKIVENQEVLTHYGTIISPVTSSVKEAVNEIKKQQKESLIFQKAIKKLSGKLIDCTNFCPSKTTRGLNLTAYSEARM